MTDPSPSSSDASEEDEGLIARCLADLFGTTFVVIMLVIALFVPDPTTLQQFVFRIVL